MLRRTPLAALVASLLGGCSEPPAEQPRPIVFDAAGAAGQAGAGASAGGNQAGAGQAGQGGASAGAGGAAGAPEGGELLPCDVEKFLKKRCDFCHTDPPKYGAPLPLVSYAHLVGPSFSDPSVTAAAMALVRMQDKKKPMPDAPNPPATAAEIALIEGWINAGYPPRPSPTCDEAGGAGGAGAGGASAGQGGAGASGAGAGGSPAGAGGAGAGGSAAGSGGAGSGGAGAAGAGGAAAGGAAGAGAGGAAGAGGSGQAGAGAAGQAGAAGGGGAGPTVCTDVVVGPSSPWQMPPNEIDQYACFGFDVPVEAFKRQVVAITPKIANDTIVHHLLLLSAPEAQPSTPQPCASLPPFDWRLLYAWAPGTPELQLPPEAGYPIDAGQTMHLVMQVHYSNLKKLPGQSDTSGVTLCTTDQLRTYDADIMAFGSMNFTAGPHQTTKIRCASDAPADGPLTLFQSWPHMHTLGVGFDSRVVRPDGTEIPLVSTDNYSFYSQVTYPTDVDIKAGDQVITTCTWDNSTSDPVKFGEATSEEMCFNFISYYPRIEGSWNWIYPAFSASCQSVP